MDLLLRLLHLLPCFGLVSGSLVFIVVAFILLTDKRARDREFRSVFVVYLVVGALVAIFSLGVFIYLLMRLD